MVSWIIIIILVIIGLLIIKIGHIKHSFFIIILILLGLFLYTSITYVSEKNNLDLSTTSGFFSSAKVYTGWLANGFKNLKDLTSRVIDMDWRSTNESF